MNIHISAGKGHVEDMRRLAEELRWSPEVREVQSLAGPARSDRLGAGTVEVLTVVLGAGGAGSAVVTQVALWLRRASEAAVRLSLDRHRWIELPAVLVKKMNSDELAVFVQETLRTLREGEDDA
jgi:hypothetical protein